MIWEIVGTGLRIASKSNLKLEILGSRPHGRRSSICIMQAACNVNVGSPQEWVKKVFDVAKALLDWSNRG